MARLRRRESDEHEIVALWLDVHGIVWFHPPNGGSRHVAEAVKMKRMGVKAGVPDFVIIDRPPAFPEAIGTVIELKADKLSRVRPEQKVWLSKFGERSWRTAIAHGAVEAIAMLKELGYAR